MNASHQTNSDNAKGSRRLDGKTALVTGAAGGLGQSFTRCLVEAGASVIVSGRRREALESLKAEFSEHADRIHVVTMDVTNESSVAEAFNTMADEIAIPDVVVSNAGVATSKKALDLNGQDWDRVIDTNLKGC